MKYKKPILVSYGHCEECKGRIEEGCEPFLIKEKNEFKLLYLCKKCSDKRMDTIREMLGVKGDCNEQI